MYTNYPTFKSIMDQFVHLAFAAILLTTLLLFPGSNLPAAANTQTNIPGPAGSGEFGQVTVLPNGNIVVQDPGYDVYGTQEGIGNNFKVGLDSDGPVPIVDAGAVYLYNGTTGALISSLTGSTAGDRVGSDGVTVLSNGNYLVRSTNWDHGAAVDAGAVTWGSGTMGMSGVVSPANSLVGSTVGDHIGSFRVTEVSNGNYVLRSPDWDHGAAVDAGAVTWGSGTMGVSGAVSPANSLVGSTAGDRIGYGDLMALSNGNYLVRSPNWHNGAAVNAGAVTWGNGTTGISGVVSPANSLVGSTAGDQASWVTELSNGNYVVSSPYWDNGAAVNAGAVTWGSGTTGVSGIISAVNSLVGLKAEDQVGCTSHYVRCFIFSVFELSNGNFVVRSPDWDNGEVADAGAVTWMSGTTGVTGAVSAANSLVGTTAGDKAGWLTTLSNGNYVVATPDWDNGAVVDVGAVTWADGMTGLSGEISEVNSLVGSTAGDRVASIGATSLTNGNYVVLSPDWDNGAVVDVGAVTWGNGTTSFTGAVSSANSLVGSTAGDRIGDTTHWSSRNLTALSNGNYVVESPDWDQGELIDVGGVMWGTNSPGATGVVSEANSLVGFTAGDKIGNIVTPQSQNLTALSNGNYVLRSPIWDNGAAIDAGAVTWGNGTTGVVGAVSAANSLVGSTAGDQIGFFRLTELSNGNFVVESPKWDNGLAADAGAVTWGNGAAGVSGVVSPANSLVGSTAGDGVGYNPYYDIMTLNNGNYVVSSPYWHNGAASRAGAVTWGNGTTGVSGVVSAANSLVGSTAGDQIGCGAFGMDTFCELNLKELNNGNYVVLSPEWDNGPAVDAGAVTWGDGMRGVSGVVSAANSLVGSQMDDRVGWYGFAALSNGNYVVVSSFWDNGPAADAGAVTWGSGTTGVSGVLSAANSLVGSTAGDAVGSTTGGWGDIPEFSNSNYLVESPNWDNGTAVDAGAVTWGNGTTGVVGEVSAANSLVGTTAGDRVGSAAGLNNGSYLVVSTGWDNGTVVDAGAVTWGNGLKGVSGEVSAANSLVGFTANDRVGSGGVTGFSDSYYVVVSPDWDNGPAVDAGAVTFGNGMACANSFRVGAITTENSVLGTFAGGGKYLNFGYDPIHHQLVVGRPADNMVSLFVASECAYQSYVPVVLKP